MHFRQLFAVALLLCATACAAQDEEEPDQGGNLRNFESCRGGSKCAGKRACFKVTNATSIQAAFFPLTNCRQKTDIDPCVCLQAQVTSGVCDAASFCSLDGEGAKCTENKQCKQNNNMCFKLNNDNTLDNQLCNHFKDDNEVECRCATPDDIRLKECSADADCRQGEEICQTVAGVSGKRCVGSSPSDLTYGLLPDYVPPEPCIAVEELEPHTHLKLVFKEHRRGSVLCDGSGSCASAGHIVQYDNEFMSMNSYCARHAEGGCRKTVRMVNSPRMSRGLRVPSRTDKLQYTALSARYETPMEERLLTFVLRCGL